jgi:predicted Fe-S protein YdhL (DUF1289 family)
MFANPGPALRDPRRAGMIGAMNGPPKPIATPCIKVCVVDGESGLCMGCYRTLAEVASWSAIDDETRRRIMADLPGRRARVAPEKLAMFSRA